MTATACDAAEDDVCWFRINRTSNSRTRHMVPGEFPFELDVPPGREPVVIVAVTRDKNGEPEHRARGLIFARSGHA
jgi:hypothetical protein